MAKGIKLIPLSGITTDVSNPYMRPDLARFVKNLYYSLTDNAEAVSAQGAQLGVMKPLQANEVYCPIELPKGHNTTIGTCSSRYTKELYVFVHNSNDDHCIFRINGGLRSCTMVKVDPCFIFKLDPRNFIHESGAWIEVVNLIDPDTKATLRKIDLYWTDGDNYMGYLRVNDCIDTNGFNDALFPYFKGDYDRCAPLRMGLPTPKDCIKVEEIPVVDSYVLEIENYCNISAVAAHTIIISTVLGKQPQTSDRITIVSGANSALIATFNVVSTTIVGNNYNVIVQETVPNAATELARVQLYSIDKTTGTSNKLLFNTWQFRVVDTDVFGRVSIYGIISDIYIPGVNDCLSVSSNLPNCLNLTFDAGNPFINTKEIAWRNCNEEAWKTETTLFLYDGSNIGKWWLRPRNPDINYDPETNQITYRFCRDKECDPIDVATTNLLQPALPKSCQSLFPLNNAIATANNRDGFNPFTKELLSKIKATVIPPQLSTDLALRTITIYVAIGNMDQQVVFRDGKYHYGGGVNGGVATVLTTAKKQYFKNVQQSGFCGYLVNGPTAISTQVYIDAAGNLIDDPNFNGYFLSPTHRTLQKFVFYNVSKGSYIFRIASQIVDPASDSDYRMTSTPIWGLVPFSAQNNYDLGFNDRRAFEGTCFDANELYLDCCEGDYDTLKDNKMLVIANMAYPFLFSICGYFSESETNNTRWELMKVSNALIRTISSIRTDANGFYWAYTVGDTNGGDLGVSVATYSNCQRIISNHGTIHISTIDMQFSDFLMDHYGFTPAFQSVPCNYTHIKGRLVLENTGIGISNAIVFLTRGSTGQYVTDADGYFDIIAHDDGSNETPYGVRNDKIIISGACTYYGANGECVPITDVSLITCAITSPNQCQERELTIFPYTLSYKKEQGLLSGGTYQWFVNAYDWLGRKTYSQPLGEIKIPSIIQTKAIAPSTVRVDIDPSAIFPPEIQYITFSLTEETTIEKYISWIVDRIEFIDNKGDIDLVSPAQIKIYYGSIIEFDAINNYNTTTAWQIIPENGNRPVVSDKVRFFLNGNGQFFTKDIVSLIKYDQSGTYFTIDYTSDLADIKENAFMRLERPKNCTGAELNYEVCKVVNIINGQADQNQFLLNAFDTYYLSRQIPVPVPVTPTPTVSQISTVNGNVTTTVIPVPVPTVLSLQSFAPRFEHSCPSNFWGQGSNGIGCHNIGRPNSKNPYEAELIHQDEIAFGGGISINGQLNYQQYFLVENKHSFKIPNTGGIIYVSPKQGLLLIITQNNNFTVGYGDNLTRVVNGVVVAPSGADTFGNPNMQVNGNYGCQIWDKNTIRERDGLVHFLDSSRVAILQHNFQSCQDISSNKTNPNRRSTILSWLSKKIISVTENNNADNAKRFFHSVVNPANNEYLISDFTIGGFNYINDERDYTIGLQETMAFDIKADVWKGQYSFTPQYYGFLESDLTGNQLFSFIEGVPYSHYSTSQTKFNTFYGVKCSRVYTFVVNDEIMKKIKPQWLEIYCKQSGYYSDKIITETGQSSRILISYFKQGEFMYSGAFLRDLNTLPDPNNPKANANPLIEGDVLYGTWAEVRLIGYHDKDDVYSQLEGVQAFVITETNTGSR